MWELINGAANHAAVHCLGCSYGAHLCSHHPHCRDLKPENFLFSDKSPNAVLKATDFGISTPFKVRIAPAYACATNRKTQLTPTKETRMRSPDAPRAPHRTHLSETPYQQYLAAVVCQPNGCANCKCRTTAGWPGVRRDPGHRLLRGARGAAQALRSRGALRSCVVKLQTSEVLIMPGPGQQHSGVSP